MQSYVLFTVFEQNMKSKRKQETVINSYLTLIKISCEQTTFLINLKKNFAQGSLQFSGNFHK